MNPSSWTIVALQAVAAQTGSRRMVYGDGSDTQTAMAIEVGEEGREGLSLPVDDAASAQIVG